MSVRYSSNGYPVPGAFTGTIPALIDWLSEFIHYGGVKISEPRPSELFPRHQAIEVETVTGGYSDDEDLLGRLKKSLFGGRFWKSSHRGGLTVYEVPLQAWESQDQITWVDEETDVFEQLYLAREVSIETSGSRSNIKVPHGVELRYSLPDTNGRRDQPGTLHVRAFGEQEVPPLLRRTSDELDEYDPGLTDEELDLLTALCIDLKSPADTEPQG